MHIVVEARLGEARVGVTARATRLRLAAHGSDTVSATFRLAETVKAWAVSLERGGWLAQALDRTGVEHDGTGDGIEVEVRPLDDTGRAKAPSLTGA